MIQEEIIEGNKLIASFIGWQFFEKSMESVEGYPFGGHDYFEEREVWIKNPTDKYKEILCHYGYENINEDLEKEQLYDDWCYALLFNSSWDWLVPVVEKIESLNYRTTAISTLLLSGEMLHIMAITDNDDHITYWNEKGDTKIEAVWKACVEFIKSYNNK